MANSKRTDFSFTICDTKYGVAPAMRRGVKRQFRKVIRMEARGVIITELDAHEQGCLEVPQMWADEEWEIEIAGTAVTCTSTSERTVAVHQDGARVWEVDLELEALEDRIEEWREASGFYGSW